MCGAEPYFANRGSVPMPIPTSRPGVFEKRARRASRWSAGVLFNAFLIGSGEALALPMAGEYQLDVGSELQICSETTGCEAPVSIAGARFWFDPNDPVVLQRELTDGTYDLYVGDAQNAMIYRIHTVIDSPDIGPYAFSDDSRVTFSTDSSFRWTGSFEGFLSCDSFGLDPNGADCWSSEPRDFLLINVSATMLPEPGNATLLGSGLLGMLAIRGAMRRRPASSGAA
jgi:hypothetical protein